MPQIGVRELKARTSEILRQVRDRRARYTVTNRGRPVGVLLPVGDAPQEAVDDPSVWDNLSRLGEEIAKEWPASLGSGEVLSDMRR